MKYLFYFYSCFNSTMFGELLDEAVKLSKDKTNKVSFLTCDGVNKMCMSNKMGSKPICEICRFCSRKIIEKHNINFISLANYSDKNIKPVFNYKTTNEFRSIKYRDVSIGLSIFSSYMSITRNMNPKIDNVSKRYFDEHLTQNIIFIDALHKIIEEYSPDCVYSYNGRYEEVRPIYDICKNLQLNFTLLEVVQKNGKWYKTGFNNCLPHDIKENINRREYCWNNYDLTENEKIKLGNSFYHKRRYGEFSGDKKIYVANQKEGYVPDFKIDKINIAIMNSSEDEFAAVGEEWDALKLFDTQFEGIIYLLEYSPDTVHFYLRIHPNLKSVPYKYHKELEMLPFKYCNITIIPANSEMSTYTLMEKVDKIISFGSTMGLESVYWGKPSILIGPSFYYFDNINYVPSQKSELINLLTQDLNTDSSNINILKLGAYLLNKDPLIIDLEDQFKYVDYNSKRISVFGKELHITPILDFIVNKNITGYTIAILRFIFDNRFFRRFRLPLEEE